MTLSTFFRKYRSRRKVNATGILVALFSFFGFVSCETELEYNDEVLNKQLVTSPFAFEDGRPAYEGLKGFSSNSARTDILLTESLHVLHPDSLQVLQDALVQMREKDGEWVTFELSRYFEWYYYSSDILLLEEGNSYEYRAKAVGFEEVYGSFNIPIPVEIKDVEFVRGFTSANSPLGYDYGEYDITFEDPAGANYYSITSQMKNDSVFVTHFISTNHPAAQTNNDLPSYTFSRDILLVDESSSGGEITIRVLVYGMSNPPLEDFTMSFTLHTHDEHSFKYNSSVLRQRRNTSEDVPFTQPVVIYSNIENGLGYVGGFSSDNFEL